MEIPRELRERLSFVTSLAVLVTVIGLPYIPDQYMVAYLAVAFVLLIDTVVKALNLRSVRDLSSALYSLAMALALFTFFPVLGSPLSQLFALLFIVDAVLKYIPGDQYIPFLNMPEDKFRHYFSAVVTTLLGLAIMFGVAPFNSVLLGFVLGLAVLIDGIVKLEYARIL